MTAYSERAKYHPRWMESVQVSAQDKAELVYRKACAAVGSQASLPLAALTCLQGALSGVGLLSSVLRAVKSVSLVLS